METSFPYEKSLNFFKFGDLLKRFCPKNGKIAGFMWVPITVFDGVSTYKQTNYIICNLMFIQAILKFE